MDIQSVREKALAMHHILVVARLAITGGVVPSSSFDAAQHKIIGRVSLKDSAVASFLRIFPEVPHT